MLRCPLHYQCQAISTDVLTLPAAQCPFHPFPRQLLLPVPVQVVLLPSWAVQNRFVVSILIGLFMSSCQHHHITFAATIVFSLGCMWLLHLECSSQFTHEMGNGQFVSSWNCYTNTFPVPNCVPDTCDHK